MSGERRYYDEIRKIAVRAGIAEPRVVMSGKSPHPKIYGKVGDKILKRAVPGSPSDYRSLKNL